MTPVQSKIEDFLIARGGPFHDLQIRLGLLREDALGARWRALAFIGAAWGVPLLLSFYSGLAWGPVAERPFLLDAAPWAKFFIAVGCFILTERFIEERLRWCLREFVRAPVISPASFEATAAAVTRSLEQRNSPKAEALCLALAIALALVSLFNLYHMPGGSWIAQHGEGGTSLTPAGIWCYLVSIPIFWFLLLRGFWRHFIWSLLLRRIAAMDLRIVVSHPDGKGGLAFIGHYPNAYSLFVFGMSCAIAAAVLRLLLDDGIGMATYGYIMGIWLAIVLGLVSLPLAAFVKPLSQLKRQTLLAAGAQATRFHRQSERKLLGGNIFSPDRAETLDEKDAIDSSKHFELARKMSVRLLNRSAILPVTMAALLPLAAAGVTELPYKELLSVVKKLLIL